MEEQQPSQRSRRDFLEKIGAAAAFTGAAVTGAALGIFPEAHAQSSGQQPIPDPPTWPESDPNFVGSPSQAFILSGAPFYNSIVTEGGTQQNSPDSLHHGHDARIAPAIAERLHPDDAPPPAQSYLTFIPSPNILVVLVDELWNDLWLPATSSTIATPTTSGIDSFCPNVAILRDNSFRFTNYYVAACNCSPSRSAMLTGLYTRQTKMYCTQRTTTPDLSVVGSAGAGYSTWGTALQDPAVWQGSPEYAAIAKTRTPQANSPYSGNVSWCGKWHLSCAGTDLSATSLTPYGFQVWRPGSIGVPTAPSPNGYANEGQQPLGGGTWIFMPCSGSAPTLYYDSDTDIATQAAGQIASLTSSRTGAVLSSWCAVVSFVNPHDIQSYPGYFSTPSINYSNFQNPATYPCPSPPNPMRVNDAYYPPEGSFYAASVTPFSASTSVTPTPPQAGVTWNNSDSVSPTIKPALQSLFKTIINRDFGAVTGTDTVGEQPWQDFLNNYVWLRSLVDAQIGSVVSAVPTNQKQNTVIIFSSDHGDYAGSHGLHGKGGSAYEEAINVPLYVLYPNGTNGSGQVQYLTARADFMCSSVDLFSLIVETFTGAGNWRTLPKYQDQAARQSIFYQMAHPGSQETRFFNINSSPTPYILFTADEIVASEETAYCLSPSFAYNTPSHVTCLRTKTAKSVSAGGQITYTSTTNSAKLVVYDYWPAGQDYPGTVPQQAELYDYTYLLAAGAPNYAETGNQYGASTSAAIQAALAAALGTYTTGQWGSELQVALGGIATDGSTPLQNSPLTNASVVGNALMGGNSAPGSVSGGYYAYANSQYYNYNPTCPSTGSEPDDAAFTL
jgi:hypothetical protein